MKNTFVKVLSFMMALTMIVGAFGAITVSAAECAHEDRTEIAVVAPTCAVAGFTRYECNDCGEEFIDDIRSATGKHSWTEVAATAATCEAPAYSAHKKCSVCSAVEGKVAEGTALGHIWNIDYKQAATCTEDGFTSKKCARCDKVDDVLAENGGNKVVSATDKAAHKYIYTVVTAPTACASGSIEVTCSACDYNATIAQTEDHNWKDMTSADAADILTKKNIVVGEQCNATYKSGKICIDCGAVKDTVAAPKTHAYAPVDFATITATNLTAELQALGFKVDDATKGETATCVASSWELSKCTICNTYAKVTVQVNEGKGHDWNAWGETTPADTDANHAVDKTQTRTCKNCDATETKVVKAASACVYTEEDAKVVTYPTCTANGYTTYTCDKCNDVTTGDVTFATGHAYGEWKYVTGYNCLTSSVTNAMVRTCGNKNKNNNDTVCGHPEYKDAEAKTAHKFVKETVPATCVEDAKYQNKCSDCGFIEAIDPATDAPAKGKDPNNHVVTTSATPVEENVVKASCTNKAQNRYLCSCGALVDLEVGATPAHTKGTVYHVSACGKDANAAIDASCKADCKSVAKQDATCKATGIKTAGEICTVCGVVITAPVVAPIDSTKHIVDGVFVEDGEATCVSKAYTTSYYSCCGIVHKIETGDVVETAHGAKLKDVAAVAATCTAKGVAAHQKCEACGLLWKADETILTKAKAVTLASLATATADGDLVHDWNTTAVPEVPETCTVPGTKAYFTCKDCTTHIKVGDLIVCDDPATTDKNERDEALKIAAHGAQYMGWQKGQAPTCTEDGYRFNGVTDATKYYTETIYCCAKCDKIAVAKNGHTDVVIKNHNLTTAADYNCTLDSYKVVECSVCKATYFKDYSAAAKTAHEYTKWADGDKKGQDKADAVVAPKCTTAGVEKYFCVNCEYVDERPGAAATGHAISVNGVSIKVDFGCTSADHVDYKGFKCSCGEELGLEADYEHNVVTAKAKAPTCTTTGNTEFDYCVDCGMITRGTVTEIPATGHDYSDLIEVVDGVAKYSCPDCGEFVTENVVELDTTISVENALVAAGSKITVAVNVTADAFAFNQLYVEVYGYAFDIVSVELVYDFGATTHVDYYEYGFVIYTEHDVNGDPTFVTLDGEDVALALVTLQVSENAWGEYDIYSGAYGAVVDFDEDGEVWADILDDEDYVTVDAVIAGELNGDGIIGVSDIQKLMNLVANGSTDAIADVNRDGVVDVFDIAALRAFVSSNGTAYDYLVMTGVDVEGILAAVAPDMDDDGKIGANDEKLFTTLAVEELKDMSYYVYLDGCAVEGFESFEEVAEYLAWMIIAGPVL
ncbi:MAG: hypothetical protein IJY39_11665 [Clostridia bacterium]|nr:hypothetical protein [Clostridia bacterium]